MAKLPMYQRKVTPQAQQATAQQYGAGVASAQGDMGNVLQQIGDNARRRNEVIDRVRLLTEFDQNAMADLNELKNSTDFTDPDAVDSYKQALRDRAETAIANHKGRSQSKAEFRSQIENQIGQYTKSAMADQIKVQNELIATDLQNTYNTVGNKILDNPEYYGAGLEEMLDRTNKFSPGMTAPMERAAKDNAFRLANSTLVQGMTQRLSAEMPREGEPDPVALLEDRLNDETFTKYLDQKTLLSARADISTIKAERDERQRAIKNRIDSFEVVTGQKSTPDQQEMIANLPDPSKMTVGQKMMEMQSILGRPLNEPERLKLMGLEQTERAMNRNEAYAMIHSGWARFTNGSMSQGERIQYQLAWEQAGLLPGHRQNPVTKAIEYVNPSLPPELSRMRDVVMGQQAVEAYRQPSPFDYSGQVRDAIAPDLQNDQQIDYGSDEGQLQVQQSRDQLISMLPEGKGLYDMVGDTATVGGWLKEKMFNIPGIGDQLGIDPQTIENRQFARMMTDQAIRAFALNRKFPVQEIARLIEQYPLNPKLSTEGAMQSYIRAVDKAIDVAIAGRQMALQSGSISLDAQKDAVDTIQDMKTLKRILNVSNEESGKPLTLSVEELDVMVNSGVLKPGDEFVGTDGKTYRVRGQ